MPSPSTATAQSSFLGALLDAQGTTSSTSSSSGAPAQSTLSDGLYILVGILAMVIGLWAAMRGGPAVIELPKVSAA